ncbi:DNA-binding transcriptional regulator, MocR family, contains an aminotransferase domain [bacterium A37T11]|nr:DNA-binding transcriptional regulator, MocR family, contains an aminotransferase domain [bacterium A37T11]
MLKKNEHKTIWEARISKGQCSMTRLAEIIIEVIQEGLLSANDLIPSLSSFAELSGMSENAVRDALTGPLLAGYLYRVQGSGTFVSPDAPCFKNQPNYFSGNPSVPLYAPMPAESAIDSSCILGIELPGPALFKNRSFLKYVNAKRQDHALMDPDEVVQLYQDRSLVHEMRLHLNQRQHLQLEARNFTLRYHYPDTLLSLVHMLSGQQDHIICTEPVHPWLNQALRSKGGQLLTADTAQEEQFLYTIRQQVQTGKVRLLYINTRCSRSNSHTLSQEALQQLLSLCLEHRVIILEEDNQHEFWYEEIPFKPLAAHDHQGHVVYLSPVSQLNRYLNAVWQVAAAPSIMEKLGQCPENLVRLKDLEKDQALLHMLQTKEWNAVLGYARTEARNSRDLLCRLIDNYLHQQLTFAEPKAGFIVHAQMRDGSSAAAFLQKLSDWGVRLPCMAMGSAIPLSSPFIRLGFGVSFNKKSEQEFKKIRQFLEENM